MKSIVAALALGMLPACAGSMFAARPAQDPTAVISAPKMDGCRADDVVISNVRQPVAEDATWDALCRPTGQLYRCRFTTEAMCKQSQ